MTIPLLLAAWISLNGALLVVLVVRAYRLHDRIYEWRLARQLRRQQERRR